MRAGWRICLPSLPDRIISQGMLDKSATRMVFAEAKDVLRRRCWFIQHLGRAEDNLHPVLLAYIHSFMCGNGKAARLLVNLNRGKMLL